MKSAKVPKYASEADLCSQFIAWAQMVDQDRHGGDAWTAYAETQGWDILLVRKSDGCQIGIEAKLQLNTHVILQALEGEGRHYAGADRPGPDYRAVLVPASTTLSGLSEVANHCGLTVIAGAGPGELNHRGEVKVTTWWRPAFEPCLPMSNERHHYAWGANRQWFDRVTTARHKLPEYVPDCPAGVPSPAPLSDWKIRAIKAALILERRGYIMRADFTHLHLDHRRWAQYWLKKNTTGPGWVWDDSGRFQKPDLKRQHPKNWDQIAADYDKWATPAPDLLAAIAKAPGARPLFDTIPKPAAPAKKKRKAA